MQLPVARLIEAGWFIFIAYWAIQARAVKSTARSEPFLARFLKYWLPLMVGTALVLPWRGGDDTLLRARFAPPQLWLPLLGVLLLWAGVAFAIWARATLGRNWSAVVQVKRDHELVERGPYRWVRHPIYTGLLMAFLGTALALGEWRGLLGTAIVGVSFWFKLKLEERWMREQFGVRYDDYMRRVKALVPGVL
ncbi:MAG TPA: isoprenylcysteine carboxylmethyltransferase family protein [Dyella sp.]|nr:isoprenylcysteine carboxylmethyltransferase family protein [Dyella sp.]